MSANITTGFELDDPILAMCESTPAPQSPIIAQAIAMYVAAGFPAGPVLDAMAQTARDQIMENLVGLANAAMVQAEREIVGQQVRQSEAQESKIRHFAYCAGARKPRKRLTRAEQTILDAQRFGTCPAGVVA